MSKGTTRMAFATALILGICSAAAALAGPAEHHSSAIQLLLAHARYWRRHGRDDLAAERYRRVLQARPGQPQALTGLGEYEARQGHFGKARHYLAQLKTGDPGTPGVAAIQALLRVGSGAEGAIAAAAGAAQTRHFQTAVADYHKAFGPTPPAPWASTYFNALSQTHGGWATAVAQARRLHAAHPQSTGYTLALARLLIEHADTRLEGIHLAENIAAARSRDAGQARQIWHQGLNWMGDDPKAIPYLKRYLKRYADTPFRSRLSKELAKQEAQRAKARTGTALAHAYALIHAGQLDRAQTTFAKLVHAQPPQAKAYEGLAVIAAKRHHFDKAARYDRQAAKLAGHNPAGARLRSAARNNDFWAWMHKGKAAGQAQHYGDAVRDYRQALGIKPKSSQALAALANTYRQQGEAGKAASLLKKLAALKPKHAAAWQDLMNARRQLKEPARVLEVNARMPTAVRQQLDQRPGYAKTLAWAQQQTGATHHAIETLTRAAAHHPGNAAADLRLQLAWLLYRAHRDRALYHLLQTLRQQHGLTAAQTAERQQIDFDASAREARQALQNGDKTASQAIVKRLEQRHPGDPKVERLHAALLVQSHQYKPAVALYKKAGVGDSAGDYAAAAGAALAAGDYRRAHHWAEQGLALAHGPARHRAALARIDARAELQLGDTAAARQTLQTALDALPGSAPATSAPDLVNYPFARPAAAKPVPAGYPFSGHAQLAASQTTSAGPRHRPGLSPQRRQAIDNDRQKLQTQLAAINAQTSAQVGGGAGWRSRSGTAGLSKVDASVERLTGVVAPSYNTQLQFSADQVHIDAGSANGNAARQLGTAPVTGAESGAHPSARGSAIKARLVTPDLSLMVGSGPLGFPVHQPIGRLNWQLPDAPLDLQAFHRNVRDSVLSYAGIKDAHTGTVWGGVYASGLSLYYNGHQNRRSTHASIEAATLRGRHVASNSRLQGSLSETWRTYRNDHGRLDVGYDVLAMAYRHNLSHFTYGQGGYFSPSYYLRPSATFDWQGHAAGSRLDYELGARLGWQTYHNSSSAYFPTDSALQAQSGDAHFAGQSKSGLGYGLHARATYDWGRQLFLSGFVATDNSHDYTNVVGGLKLRFTFAPEVDANGKTRLPAGLGNTDIFETGP